MPAVEQEVLPRHIAEEQVEATDAALIHAAISELPADSHQRILTALVTTARRCEVNRNYGPLSHLIESVFATANLHRNEEYQAALAAARAEDTAGDAKVVGIEDYFTQARGTRKR